MNDHHSMSLLELEERGCLYTLYIEFILLLPSADTSLMKISEPVLVAARQLVK